MKKKELLAIASLSCLVCCGSPEKETSISPQQLLPLQFSIRMEAEIAPFPTTKEMPPLDIPEPTPGNPEDNPNGNPDENEPYTYIEYLVYQTGEASLPVKHKRYTSADMDFGIVYDTLPPGDYHLCFLAHSEKELSVNGQTATFGNVSDTFLASLTQMVKTDTEIVRDINLARIVSRIEFIATEAAPEELRNLDIHATGYQDKIDLLTGEGVSGNTPYARSYTLQPGDIGKTGLTYTFYTFVPADGKSLSSHLTAYDKAGKILRSRDIGTITPIRNRVIRYTGNLYTPPGSDDTFTLHITDEGKWGDPVDNELKD